MIYITGDTHGDFGRVVKSCEQMETEKEDILQISSSVEKLISG